MRLPDEWEWQRAATAGDDANVYPWGRDWDPGEEPFRVNTFESRLGVAKAVGMYPAGGSPAEVLDMAGTVWEWCLNKHDSLGVTESGESVFYLRVLRGGSWISNKVNARSADRNRGNYPRDRYGSVGFQYV